MMIKTIILRMAIVEKAMMIKQIKPPAKTKINR